MNIAAAIAGIFAAIGGFFVPKHNAIVALPETAMVYTTAAPLPALPAEPTSTAAAISELPEIAPGLLPKVTLALSKPKPAARKPAPAPAKIAATVTAPTPLPLPAHITAQWILDNTTFSFKTRFDGTYALVFATKSGGVNVATWDLTNQTIGGVNGVPQFNFSFTCNPPPTMPPFNSPDMSPAFAVRTTYGCDLSLAATGGSDRRAVVKHFDFTTSAGPLVISHPSSMNTVLQNDKNVGYIVFNNENSEPVTITSITFDAAYTALGVIDTPLVVRFLDPATDAIIVDQHLENMPKDPADQWSAGQTGITIPMNFTVPGNTEKALPVNVIGVHHLSITGVNPMVRIAVTNVGTTSGVKTIFQSPVLEWTCVVPVGAFDPNSTSDAFATGQACR